MSEAAAAGSGSRPVTVLMTVQPTAVIGTARSAPTTPRGRYRRPRPQDRQPMDGQDFAHQHRLQEMVLELVHTDDHGENDQRGHGPVGKQCYRDGQGSGGGGSDDRNETADEDEDGQRQCRRDAHKSQSDAHDQTVGTPTKAVPRTYPPKTATERSAARRAVSRFPYRQEPEEEIPELVTVF